VCPRSFFHFPSFSDSGFPHQIDLAEAIGAVSLLERLEPLASFKPAAARSQGNDSRSQSFDSKVDLIDVEIDRVERFWRNYDPT